jgi:hypothetical protein
MNPDMNMGMMALCMISGVVLSLAILALVIVQNSFAE